MQFTVLYSVVAPDLPIRWGGGGGAGHPNPNPEIGGADSVWSTNKGGWPPLV